MEERFMGAVTAIILTITIALCFLLIFIPNFHGRSVDFQTLVLSAFDKSSMFDLYEESEFDISYQDPAALEDMLKGHQVRLSLPEGVTGESVSISSDYMSKMVTVNIDGIGRDYFDNYPMSGSCNNIVDISYETENYQGKIYIQLDDVFEVKQTLEDNSLFIDFVDPHELYDYVVVVDAGHGGRVPGANKLGVKEKDINLDIVLQLKKIFDETGKNIKVYYTRTTDVNPGFADRVGLVNDLEADLFVSIHNNSTASGRMSDISGTQVMYRGADASGNSKAFAKLCLEKLTSVLDSKSKGTVVGDENYIIRESKSPVVLIEVGFMTNKEELELLNSSSYQQKAARAIYSSIVTYLYEGVEEN